MTSWVRLENGCSWVARIAFPGPRAVLRSYLFNKKTLDQIMPGEAPVNWCSNCSYMNTCNMSGVVIDSQISVAADVRRRNCLIQLAIFNPPPDLGGYAVRARR
jgi:hypothetical protein